MFHPASFPVVIAKVGRTALNPSLLPTGVVIACRDGWAVQHVRSPFLGKLSFLPATKADGVFGACPSPRCGEATVSSDKAITTCLDDRTAHRMCSDLIEISALFAVILEMARQATALFFCCQNR